MKHSVFLFFALSTAYVVATVHYARPIRNISDTSHIAPLRKPMPYGSQPPMYKKNATNLFPAAVPQHHTITIYKPVPCPNEDRTAENATPKGNVSLSYRIPKGYVPSHNASDGVISMNLALKKPAVVLDTVEAISKVECGGGSVIISFDDSKAFDQAKESWLNGGFSLITSGIASCSPSAGHTFYLVQSILVDHKKKSITCYALKQDISQLAESLEMEFSSIPSSKLKKRLTLNPKTSVNFNAELPAGTVLAEDKDWGRIQADEAEFSTVITFSGYLKYNFQRFKLEKLDFDISTHFSADVALSAEVMAAWSRSLIYDPGNLTYNLISVPGLVSLGPGVAFAVGVDIDTSAAVSVSAGAGITIPAGKIHLDLLDSTRNKASGWKPKYTSHANVSEHADTSLNATASVTVQLDFKLLGGLVDLSSGLTAKPKFINKFSIDAQQSAGTTDHGVLRTSNRTLCTCDMSYKSDFAFELVGFVTQWWRAKMYQVELPIVSGCYDMKRGRCRE
ncbi:hypothetical protein FMEXI_4796 [Fusarium mexicanum]|uniref:DUF7029 domain-containing protein n=1 Tax=Fusarium mexicanum TaxID=751941 RepID=A0A8H5J4W2_9HYPO|nr:hypothetical protein FMEXI_4796 [Fusarium mexicanum]